MKKQFMVAMVLSASILTAQWQPMGVTSGLVNGMIADPTQNLILIATDSGVSYATASDLSAWSPLSGGLRDFNVLKMIWTPLPGNFSAYAVLTPSGVHATSSKVLTSARPWVPADPLGLMDGSGNMGYQGSQALGFYASGGTLYVYLAVRAGVSTSDGIYYRSLSFDLAGVPSWDATGWHRDTAYSYSTSVFSMTTVNQAGTLLLAAEGGIYSKSGGTWAAASGTNPANTYVSLSGDPFATANSAQVIAGVFSPSGSQYSLALSTNAGISFSPLCGGAAPSSAAPFTDLFMNGPVGVGATGSAVFTIDPAACPGAVTAFTNFLGNARAVLSKGDGSILVGTAGNGLWSFPSADSPGVPVGNVTPATSTGAILTQNVSDIAQSVPSGAGPPNAPPVLFTASATSGLYKCFKPTYCTRYFFAPDRIDGVAGASVALVPGYDEFGTVSYSGFDTKVGPKTVFLGTRDFGIHRSDNGGASWRKLVNFPHPGNDALQEYEIVKVLVAPDFDFSNTAKQHLFAITRDGWIFFSADGGETWSTETGAIAAANAAVGGTGYAVGDTGLVNGCGNGQATYVVDAVSGGAVTAMHIVDPGQGYDTVHNPCTTVRTSGNGLGLTLNILETTGGKTSLAAHFVVTNDAAISPGYTYNSDDGACPPNCSILSNRILFVANSNGLVKVRIKSLSPLQYSMVPVFQTTVGAHFVPMLSVSIAPCYDLLTGSCAAVDIRERNFVLVGTDGLGIYFSPARGDAGTFALNPAVFTPSSNPACAASSTASISELTLHPKGGASPNCAAPGDAKCLLTYFVKHDFVSAASNAHGLYYMRYVPGTPGKWECQNADPAPSCHPEFADSMIPVVLFAPGFDGASNKDLYAGHANAGLWHAQHPPTSTDCTPGNRAWDPLKGFFNTPERINGLAECPDYTLPSDDHNANRIVLAGTTDMGAMISFNSGKSYYPWGLGLEDPSGHTLHDIFAVACSDRYDPCQPATACPQHRVLAAGASCTAYDISTGDLLCSNSPADAHAYFGIHWGNLPPSQYGITRWTQAQYESGPFTGHPVKEIRYCSMADPLLASDATAGSLTSQFSGPDQFGQIWHPDADPNAPASLSDITCPGGQGGPGLTVRSLPDPRSGRPSFVWGAQSGGLSHFRAGGGVKFKTSSSGSWQNCASPDPDSNWRSIVMLDTGTVLVGSEGGDAVLSYGIYRNDEEGSSCTSWAPANTGFNAGDSPGITENYSKKITAFAKVSNGVLAAMERGGLNSRPGGVFFSDTGSDGLAWVPVNSGMSCSSNYEVHNGTSIYTGSTCSGVYSTDTITYTGYPTAFFQAARSANPWHENRVDFTNRSAGYGSTPENWTCAWTFGDAATGSTCSPSHDYETMDYLNASVSLTATNNASKSDGATASVEVVDTKIKSITKVSGDTIRVTWAVPGGGKSYSYALYRDSDATGSGAAVVAGCTPSCSTDCTCEFSESGSAAFYKIKTSW